MDLGVAAAALTAGALMFFSPCAFGMLPAYITYLIRLRNWRPLYAAGAALLASLSANAVFLALAGASSALLAEIMSLNRLIKAFLATVLIALGALLFTHRKPMLALPFPSRLRRRGFIALSVSYGVAYAFASLTCSFPVFLMIVFAATSRGSTGLALLAYAVGFSAPMLLFALLTAYSARYVGKIRRTVFRYLDPVSGVALAATGIYLLIS